MGHDTNAPNPLLISWVDELRDPSCAQHRFRELISKVSIQLAFETASHLPYRTRPGRTPLMATQVTEPDGVPVIVPVLRAGLSMVDAFCDTLGDAAVALVGVARNHDTLEAEFYLPADEQIDGSTVVVCDPMLATGNSIVAVGEHLCALGASKVIVACVLAAPEGLTHVADLHPDWVLIPAVVDDRLDERGYILPGLGDAGDRWAGMTRPW